MKVRVAWLGDPEYADTYSAAEGRVVLRALAHNPAITALWFAVGSKAPPHWWKNVRVFPVPDEHPDTAQFANHLAQQLRPDVIYSNLPRSRFHGVGGVSFKTNRWIHRVNPNEQDFSWFCEASVIVAGNEEIASQVPRSVRILFLERLESASQIVQSLEKLILDGKPENNNGNSSRTCLVMRQQLFANASWSQVMFELTNSLIEQGFPAVPQDEHAMFAKGIVQREEGLFQTGASEKYRRVKERLHACYDPETAVVMHFSLLSRGLKYAGCGAFQSLAEREALYTTGNHLVGPQDVSRLTRDFERIIAPSKHVLRPYIEAGLSTRMVDIVPHGVDPGIFCPEQAPFNYSTKGRFKFLQTSFPWIFEKGFDLTVKAFCTAFSSRDDVSLILRIPRIQDKKERMGTVERLEKLVAQTSAAPGAPEIILLEKDVPPGERGSLYTGADCYLHPLRAEGFGITILEALACGLPVIATAWSGPADFLSARYAYTLRHSAPIPERTRSGTVLRFHVEPDIEHLVSLMRHVYQNREGAKTLGMRASSFVRREWTWSAAAQKLATIFKLSRDSRLATKEEL